MPRLVVAHTGQLEPATLAEARRLLDEVFAGELAEADWEHCLGGMHALVWDGAELVGHGSLVQRRLLHRDRALRTGYVEGVGVRAEARGRGHGARLMAALERVAAGAYDAAALGSTDDALGFYAARGWLRWRGPTSVLSPTGPVRTPEADGAVLVLPLAAALDLDGELTCDWRDGDVW